MRVHNHAASVNVHIRHQKVIIKVIIFLGLAIGYRLSVIVIKMSKGWIFCVSPLPISSANVTFHTN